MTEEELLLMKILSVATDVLDQATTRGSVLTSDPSFREVVDRLKFAVAMISGGMPEGDANFVAALDRATNALDLAILYGDDVTNSHQFPVLVENLKIAHLDAVFNM